MNKVHHVVWNKTLSVWQAASENTKSNTKNGKAFRLNTLTSVLASSFLGWFFPQIASAGCDIPAIPASNSVVTCTGTTSGTYTIRDVQNVQLTNEGAWNLSGTSLGIVNADTGNLTGLVVTNKGTMTWDDARYGGTGTGSRAALNVYTTGNTATKATTINGSTGTINLNVLTSSGSNRSLFGMALSAGGSDSRVFWTNDGQINVESAVDYQSGAYVGAGVARGITQVEVVNTGNVNVNQPSGTSSVIGILSSLRGGSTVPASAIVTNSGNIRVVSPNARLSMGLWLGQSAANLNNNVSVLKLNNTGTIQLDTDPAKGVVVYLEPSSLTNIFFDIDNSGALLAKDSSGWAVVLNGGATQTAKVTLNNTGTIVGNIWTESGNDQVTQTAGSISGDISLGAGSDALIASGGALIGSTYMGAGDDVASLTGTVDVTAAPQFDGGAGLDTLNIDGLKIKGFTAASNDSTGNDLNKGNNLTQWETINLNNAAKLTFTGDLFTGANVGTLNINSASTLDLTQTTPTAFSVYGDVNNGGIVDMLNNSVGTMTTITGNYAGVAGSTLKMDTVLGNDASATDKLIINGNTTGTTSLSVNNVGGTGAQTVEGIQVVQVDGASSGTFALTSPVQAGSYEYQLFQGGTSTPTDGDWYLRSTLLACEITNTCPVVPPVEPEPPVIPIYRPGVANYVVAQTSNADLGYLALDTLHQRIGEQRTLTTDNPQTWVRAIAGYTSNNGKNRFEYDQTTVGFQIGQDLLHDTTGSGTQQRAGLTTQYLRGNVDTRDRVRPIARLSEDTGHIQSTAYGLGAYYTRMTNQGAYVDLVAQVNRLDNQFNDAYGSSSKQKGWQEGLSAEVGKPVAQIKGWTLEPQAQLSYLHAHYGAFADQFSKISSLNTDHLRARLGLRVYKERHPDSSKTAQYYAIANIHHDLISPESVELAALNSEDRVGVSERYDRTSWEVGAGVQHPLSKNTYFYGDARYEQSFGDRKHSGKITFGIKSSF
jgi:outer membrane autotransporter protein